MRISYAIILAAIAMFEGCKPKEAVAPKNDGGNNDAADQEGGDNNEEDEGNALGGGQDPKNLKPNPKVSSKEERKKAHELVMTCKKKLDELESGKVALDKSVTAAQGEFDKATTDFERAKVALGKLDAAKKALADAASADSSRIPPLDYPEHLQPILNAVKAVWEAHEKTNAEERIAGLTEAAEGLRALGDSNPGTNRPAVLIWTPAIEQKLTELKTAVAYDIAAPNAIPAAREALVNEIYKISFPKEVRKAANDLKVVMGRRNTAEIGPKSEALIAAIGDAYSSASPAHDSVARKVVEKNDHLARMTEHLRESNERVALFRAEFLDLVAPSDCANAVSWRICQQVQRRLREKPKANIQEFTRAIKEEYEERLLQYHRAQGQGSEQSVSHDEDGMMDQQNSLSMDTPVGHRQRGVTGGRMHVQPQHISGSATGIQNGGHMEVTHEDEVVSVNSGDSSSRDGRRSEAAGLQMGGRTIPVSDRLYSARNFMASQDVSHSDLIDEAVEEPEFSRFHPAYLAAIQHDRAMETQKQDEKNIYKARKTLLDLIIPQNPKDRFSSEILAAADADETEESIKELVRLVQADRDAKRAAASETVVDLYADGQKFHNLVAHHEELKKRLEAPTKTGNALTACEGAIAPINPRATDRVIPAIDKYRTAKAASPSNPEAISEARDQLVEAIKGADASRRSTDPLVAHLFAGFTRVEAEVTAAGVAPIATLKSDLDAKKSTLDAAQAKVTALDKEISTQRGVCKKAEEVVGKLINPE